MRRLAALREAMARRRPEVTALLISGAANRRYLSGFRGDAGLLWVTRDDAAILVDSRFWDQAAQEAPGWRLVRVEQEPAGAFVQRECAAADVRALGVESQQETYDAFLGLRRRLKGVRVQPVRGLVERLRERKDESELAAVRRAAAITDEALGAWLPLVRPGAVEAELALELEMRLRRLGAEAAAFPPIVAAAARGAMPHALPGPDALRAGDVVVVDLGARVDGYCSDMTRTVVVPGAPADGAFADAYAAVKRALETACAAIRPGALCRAVDAVGRDAIAAAGFGENFGHGLGHSVGLEVHEEPRFSPLVAARARVRAGALLTVEPGVYLPGRFGVRLEQLVYVGDVGVEVLTRSPL